MKRPRRPIKRLLLMLLLLLGGAIVNVALAWGCAFWIDPNGALIKIVTEEPREFVGVQRRFGTLRINRMPFSPEKRAQYSDGLGRSEHLSGWPCVAMMCFTEDEAFLVINESQKYRSRSGTTIKSGLRLKRWQTSPVLGLKPGTWRALPYKMIWPGFALNTMFYAAILWLLLAFPFKLRRWRRLKRGLCPACAYPIGVSAACTECGKPVTPRSVEAVT